MEPKPIGIVGGAGPLAAISLLEQIFRYAIESYGCWKDADFPKVIVISFPFSDMLSPDVDSSVIRVELSSCLQTLRAEGAEVLGIACNTLHAFLEEGDRLSADLIQIPSVVTEAIESGEKPLILCTATSARFALYEGFIPCVYPSEETQQAVDRIITKTLQGENMLAELQVLTLQQTASVIVLGCTELSLYAEDLQVPNKRMIDPLSILSKKIIQKSFGGSYVSSNQ